jgi:predicted metal-dependent phosphoesterase TrpH
VTQIEQGSECSLSFGDFDDIQAGDVIECVQYRSMPPVFDDVAARGFTTYVDASRDHPQTWIKP